MKTKIFIAIMFFTLFAFVEKSFAYGNYQALEITNIKTAGTGSPVISQYNRIFRAYPSIEYVVPVGVIGGTFPYVFSLSNEPDGMTIDPHTGVITWDDPFSSASDITVTVHDKTGASTSATWSIEVTDSTDDFIFVDDDYVGVETGSFFEPYNSIQDVLDLGSSAANKIVYFFDGTYAVPINNSERGEATGCSLGANGGRAHIWIGYPEENITFNFSGVNPSYATWFEAYQTTINNIWFENIKFESPIRWGWITTTGNYFTFYNMRIDNLTFTDIGGNPGGVASFAGIYNYMHIADSQFNNFSTAQHLGSFYDTRKLLIERNHFNGKTGLGPSVAVKADCYYTTIRKNRFTNCTSAIGHNNNGLLHDSHNTEICFNFIDGLAGRFNIEPPPDEETGQTWFYRNTFTGRIDMVNLVPPDSCEGPWIFENNIMQNSDSGIYYNRSSGIPGQYCSEDAYLCVSDNNNLKGSANLINPDGTLIDYSQIGTYGHEIAESEYWEGSSSDKSAPTIPSGLSVS